MLVMLFCFIFLISPTLALLMIIVCFIYRHKIILSDLESKVRSMRYKNKMPYSASNDHYACHVCDYEYRTKNVAGISPRCPSCKSTSVINLDYKERNDKYKNKLSEIEDIEKEIKKLKRALKKKKKIKYKFLFQ